MYTIIPQQIPQDKRAEINEKILFSIDSGKDLIPAESLYNCYTGIGGLHNLKQSDFANYTEYSNAKKEFEMGQFFTPHELCRVQCTPKFRQLILGVFFMGIINKSKYPDAFRMRAVAVVLDDFRSYRDVAREFGVDHKTVRQWVSQSSSLSHYAGKGSYDGDFKLRVLRYRWEKGLSLLETATAFGIGSESTILVWERLYAARGAAGLYECKPHGTCQEERAADGA